MQDVREKKATEAITWLEQQGAQLIPPSIPGNNGATLLHTVRLAFRHIGPEATKALGPHLTALPALQALFLANNELGVEGAKALAPHLAAMPNLQALGLQSNDIGPVSYTHLTLPTKA